MDPSESPTRGRRTTGANSRGKSASAQNSARLQSSENNQVIQMEASGSPRKKSWRGKTTKTTNETKHYVSSADPPAGGHAWEQKPNFTQPNSSIDYASNSQHGFGRTKEQLQRGPDFRGRGRGHIRGRDNGRGGQNRHDYTAKKSTWLKSKDIPKGNSADGFPLGHQNWSDNASEHAGWKYGPDNPKIDPESGFALADWSGNWAPAPIDWDARPAFRDRQSAELIEKWLDRAELEINGKDRMIPMQKVVSSAGEVLHFAPMPTTMNLAVQGDPAPRSWAPLILGEQSPSVFWRQHVKDQTPAPLDEGDLDGAKPWWELYQNTSAGPATFLQPYEPPTIAGNDPDENEVQRRLREADMGSNMRIKNRKREKASRKLAEEDRRREERKESDLHQREFAALLVKEPVIPPTKPEVDLYLRSARESDVKEIRQIYNFCIENTVTVPEMERRSDEDMKRRFKTIASNMLPFIVAVERGARLRARQRHTGNDIVLPDKVIGFAILDDFHDLRAMYRFTVELEFYVDKDYYMKGVANCLLDQILSMIDPQFKKKGGYAIQDDALHNLGSSRMIQNALVHFPYEKPERLELMSRWLVGSLGFKKVGDLPKVGIKNERSVNLAMFQYTTSVEIDPVKPPITMSYPVD